jgi:multicomponent K+:H+ antiporter subunit G
MMPGMELPAWAALLTAVLLVLGAGLALTGSLGLLRLGSFYERVHAPTLGTAFVSSASVICFSVLQTRPVLHEILILVFITVTTPVTLMLLVRAALFRDRAEATSMMPGGTQSRGVRTHRPPDP